jgi:hypothetical protein
MKSNLRFNVFYVPVATEKVKCVFQSQLVLSMSLTAAALRTPDIRTIRAWLNVSSCLALVTTSSHVITAHF